MSACWGLPGTFRIHRRIQIEIGPLWSSLPWWSSPTPASLYPTQAYMKEDAVCRFGLPFSSRIENRKLLGQMGGLNPRILTNVISEITTSLGKRKKKETFTWSTRNKYKILIHSEWRHHERSGSIETSGAEKQKQLHVIFFFWGGGYCRTEWRMIK